MGVWRSGCVRLSNERFTEGEVFFCEKNGGKRLEGFESIRGNGDGYEDGSGEVLLPVTSYRTVMLIFYSSDLEKENTTAVIKISKVQL